MGAVAVIACGAGERKRLQHAVSGALLAAASGVGFGLFQSLNVRGARASEDPYASTFVLVGVAAVVLLVVSLAAGELASATDAPLWALRDFAIAGILHFLAGWSLLNLSQQRIGAARTSPLLSTTPLFGVAVALVTIGQSPSAVALAGIALMSTGAYVAATRGGQQAPRLGDALPGLACALMWALSPIFILDGLEGFHSPIMGLTIGLIASMLAFLAISLLSRGIGRTWQAVAGATASLKVLAGLLVGISTWWRWAALEDASVGVVLALNLLSVPIVLFVAPLIAGRHLERVTLGIGVGAALVMSGALTLVVS
jgi:DME family drug/metabolite transporter